MAGDERPPPLTREQRHREHRLREQRRRAQRYQAQAQRHHAQVERVRRRRERWEQFGWDPDDWGGAGGPAPGRGPGPGWLPPDQRRGWRRPTFIAPIVLAAVQVIGCRIAARGQTDAVPLDALAYVLLVVGPAGLVLRRTLPLVPVGIGVFAALAYLAGGYPTGPFFLAALVALFAAVRRANRAAVWAICAVAYGGYLTLALPGEVIVNGRRLANPSLGDCLVVGALLLVALALAESTRVRGAQMAEFARAQGEANRARREQTRRQASDERLQIARELHDVLGHHLSLINVRAGVGLHLLDSRPEEARAALAAIKLASAEALNDVRGVLAALNADGANDPAAEKSADSADPARAPRAPAPGLADLDRLAEDVRSAGLAVTVTSAAAPVPVPAAVDRAAYRIVQEALTNVRRHAGPGAAATVDISYAGGMLQLRVDDDGTAESILDDEAGLDDPARDELGNGIPGMRERAAALGGTLTAKPRPGGGFRVAATLPLVVDPRHPS